MSSLEANSAPASRSLWRAAHCRFDRLWLGVLRRALKFDAWHANAPYSCRPYKRRLVQLVNALRPQVVVEVGCGLGDILAHVRARRRVGFDVDAAVVRAARFLHPLGGQWVHGDVSAVCRVMPPSSRIDCLIMVNWIHNVSPEQLAEGILPLLPRVRYLLLDAIDPDAPPSYRFRHDFAFLAERTRRISATRVAGEPRSFVLLQVLE